MSGCNGGGYFQRQHTADCCRCPDSYGCCDGGPCPDFELRQHDTEPAFHLSVSDCNGPLDLTDTVVEVSMWAKGRLKTNVTAETTSLAFADNIGFWQTLPGDIVLVDRARNPEMMLVVGINEESSTIEVMRGYQATTPYAYKRGTKVRLFRILNAAGETKTVVETVTQIDGTTKEVVTDAQLIYHWKSADTCLPGCYRLEFKLLKMLLLSPTDPLPPTPSYASVGPCDLGYGVEWVRRFPATGCDGFLVRIWPSPTAENVVA